MRHFEPPGDQTGDAWSQPPLRAYGMLDHTEPDLAVASPSVLVAFDVVDADQMDTLSRGGVQLDLRDPTTSKTFWRDYWADLLMRPGPPSDDPLEVLDLFRVEMVFDRDDPLLYRLLPKPEGSATQGDPPRAEDPRRWVEFQFGAGCRTPAEVYPRMFGAPILTFTNFKPTPANIAKSLAEAFSLDQLPRATAAEVTGFLRSAGGAESLAVYDVGQGGASALLSGDMPRLYFDLGCGVYRNAATTPRPLTFCQSRCMGQPPATLPPAVILSHWDADHWAGVFADPVNYQFLAGTWIAPYQDKGKPGVPHIGLVHDILRSGGRLLIYDPPPGNIDAASLPSGRQLNLVRATGTSRNDSGFVLCVDDVHAAAEPRSWLLTGDADYDCFLELLGGRAYEACVVPHHGATLPTSVPAAKPTERRRLVFSFGPNNAHGRNGRVHPTRPAVESYAAAGWNVEPWKHVAEPGHRVGTKDTRATCRNGPACEHLGGVFIEWGLPGRAPNGCGGIQCTANLRQFT